MTTEPIDDDVSAQMVTTEMVEQGDHHWVEVTLDDGGANLFGIGEIAALSEAFDIATAHELPVLVLGRPGTFSEGLDLAVLAAGGEGASQLSRNVGRIIVQATQLPVPLVLGVTGRAETFGAMLALAADVTVMVKGDGRIGFGDVAEGRSLSPFAIELANALLRPEVALEATAHGRRFGPAAAVSVGFADEVAPPEQLLSTARERTARLGLLSMSAYRETKELLRHDLVLRLGALLNRGV